MLDQLKGTVLSFSESREVCAYQKWLPVAETLSDQNSKGLGVERGLTTDVGMGRYARCQHFKHASRFIFCFVFIFCIFIKGQSYF